MHCDITSAATRPRRKKIFVVSFRAAGILRYLCAFLVPCLASLVCLPLQCESEGKANLCDGPVGSFIYVFMFTEALSVWKTCTSFNLEWNCLNIHAIAYYEWFFRTISSALPLVRDSSGEFSNFVVDFNHSVLFWVLWVGVIGKTAYFVCDAWCSRHLSAPLSQAHAHKRTPSRTERKTTALDWICWTCTTKTVSAGGGNFSLPYLLLTLKFK